MHPEQELLTPVRRNDPVPRLDVSRNGGLHQPRDRVRDLSGRTDAQFSQRSFQVLRDES